MLLMRASATVLNNMLWTTVPSIFFFSFLRGTFLCVELNPCLSLPLIKAHKSYALFFSFVCFVSISLHTWNDAAYLLILFFFSYIAVSAASSKLNCSYVYQADYSYIAVLSAFLLLLLLLFVLLPP